MCKECDIFKTWGIIKTLGLDMEPKKIENKGALIFLSVPLVEETEVPRDKVPDKLYQIMV